VDVRVKLVIDWVNVFRRAESQWNIKTYAPSCEIAHTEISTIRDSEIFANPHNVLNLKIPAPNSKRDTPSIGVTNEAKLRLIFPLIDLSLLLPLANFLVWLHTAISIHRRYHPSGYSNPLISKYLEYIWFSIDRNLATHVGTVILATSGFKLDK
jgi:hypothetical protein